MFCLCGEFYWVTVDGDRVAMCSKFEKLTNMRIVVQERAVASIKYESKAEPLRRQSCQREECFACTTSGNGRCEKNGAGYRIECLRDGGMEDQPYTKEKHLEMLSPEEWNI